MRKKRSKYNAQKVTRNGETFDSVKEFKRWQELILLEKAGEISGLKRQVRFQLLPGAFAWVDTPKGRKWRCVERAVYYIADFVYKDSSGDIVVEDCKGYRTKEYILKRKMMLHFHNIRIKEV